MEREILQFLGTSGIYFGLSRITVASVAAWFDRRRREITPAITLRRRRSDRPSPQWEDVVIPAAQAPVRHPRWASSRQLAALFV